MAFLRNCRGGPEFRLCLPYHTFVEARQSPCFIESSEFPANPDDATNPTIVFNQSENRSGVPAVMASAAALIVRF